MKKKTRDLKKQYRYIERQLKEFELDLSDNSWYNLWHTHLDWNGITNVSLKHRKNHILYYIRILDKIEKLTSDNKRDFQTWILIDGCSGNNDAIYFHSSNPHTEFPMKFDKIVWNVEVPTLIKDLVDLSEFNIGEFKGEEPNSYIIQKKGLGLQL